jgi:hypothetical protein
MGQLECEDPLFAVFCRAAHAAIACSLTEEL